MFRIRNESDRWFDELATSEKNLFRTKFDLYYLFYLFGISNMNKNPGASGTESTHDLIDYFPQEYSGFQYMIVGLLVITELKRLGISFDDKESVQEKFEEIVDPESKAKLTSKGFSLMNDYASSGFELLQERIGGRPELATEFLIKVYENLKEDFEDAQLTD